MRHRSKFVIAGAALIALAVGQVPTGAAAGNWPDTVTLPPGFAGEGISIGAGHTFYAGSLADGRVAIGDLRTGKVDVLVDNPLFAPAVGLKADLRRGLLWVAGGPTGRAAVYDLDTGDAVASLQLTTLVPSFINDVVVTNDAAYFTNSMQPELYRVPVSPTGVVGDVEVIPLSGPAAAFVPGFNLNGIEATANGRTLIVVNSTKGQLYTVDADTGASALIDLHGGSVATGDGLFLSGHTLYVLQNGANNPVDNQIAVVELSSNLTSGTISRLIKSALFETATTLTRRGNILAAVNAQFEGAPVDAEAEVVLLPAN